MRDFHSKNTIFTGMGLALALTMAACSSGGEQAASEDSAADTAMEADSGETTEEAKLTIGTHPDASAPTNPDELLAFLKEGKYKDFPVYDTEMRPSDVSHHKMKIFYDKAVSDLLAAGNKEHPAGSTIVKEQYGPDNDELTGWSVMVKTQDTSDGGQGWFWYEVIEENGEITKLPVEPGNGQAACSSCHTVGKDFVRGAPPKS